MAYHPGMAERAGDEQETKGERRERKRRARRKMAVSGRSVRLLLEVMRRRAERAREQLNDKDL
ncbi:MAG: hypothetical protein HYU30_01740 [Chloroflexi bacterium]|nr:hypothetical protein [Chloroflexota bacterium]